MRDLVTIIIPAYNAEKYVEDAVSSVLRQTWKNLQIIIVNDGSTDKTAQICERLSKSDDRITLINKNNGGVSSARNTALPHIKGEYVMFFDADDELYPRCVEQSVCTMRKYGSDAVQVGMDIDKQSTDKWLSEGERETFSNEDILSEVLSLGKINTYLCGKMFKCELLSNLSFDENLTTGEDFVYLYQILKKCNRLTVTGDKGYHYIWNDDASTKAEPRRSFINTIDVLERLKGSETNRKIAMLWGVYISSFSFFLLTRVVKADCFKEWYPRLRKTAISYYWKPHYGYTTPAKRKIHIALLTFFPNIYYKLLKKA